MTDFQAQSTKQGEAFHQAAEFLLLASGWTITSRKTVVAGVEVDIVATNPDGREWWIECKGSYRGNVPGARRGDTAKKAVGVAAYLHTIEGSPPYMLITSHYPKKDTVAYRMLEVAKEQGWFADIKVVGFAEPVDDIGDDE